MKTLIGAVGTPRGVKTLYTDLSTADSRREPIESVAKELLALGVQPESVEALVQKTHRAIEKRRARQAAQAGVRARAIAAVEHVRKSVPGADDDFLLALASGEAIPFEGTKHRTVFKAKHDNRHPASGQYRPAAEPRQTMVGPIMWSHDQTNEGIKWAPLGSGKLDPTETDKPIPGMYGGTSNPGKGD